MKRTLLLFCLLFCLIPMSSAVLAQSGDDAGGLPQLTRAGDTRIAASALRAFFSLGTPGKLSGCDSPLAVSTRMRDATDTEIAEASLVTADSAFRVTLLRAVMPLVLAAWKDPAFPATADGHTRNWWVWNHVVSDPLFPLLVRANPQLSDYLQRTAVQGQAPVTNWYSVTGGLGLQCDGSPCPDIAPPGGKTKCWCCTFEPAEETCGGSADNCECASVEYPTVPGLNRRQAARY